MVDKKTKEKTKETPETPCDSCFQKRGANGRCTYWHNVIYEKVKGDIDKKETFKCPL